MPPFPKKMEVPKAGMPAGKAPGAVPPVKPKSFNKAGQVAGAHALRQRSAKAKMVRDTDADSY
jgi:hypothetical protein